MNAIFLIESGKAFDLVQNYIEARQLTADENAALATELGCKQGQTSGKTGVLTSLVFPRDKLHPEFTKPSGKHNVSRPKKGTEWAKRFAAQKGYEDACKTISEAFKIPGSISYSMTDGKGFHCIGGILNHCGFLYLSREGPYAMWTPDVPAAVAIDEKKGFTVEEPAKSFVMEFDGCRRIEEEEWDILVAEHQLQKKRAAKAAKVEPVPAEGCVA